MTPEDRRRALDALDRGERVDAEAIGNLYEATCIELAAAGVGQTRATTLAQALVAYWDHEIEDRSYGAQAQRIADAAAALRTIVVDSDLCRDSLRLPDAQLWGPACAGMTHPTISLVEYLERLERYLIGSRPAGFGDQYGNPTARRATMQTFVIRYVSDVIADEKDGTAGQRRHGRNTIIAKVCTIILQRPIDRTRVAQALKQTV